MLKNRVFMVNKSSLFFLICLFLEVITPSPALPGLLEKLFMPGELISGHAKYENKCKNCHENFKKYFQRDLCLACHKKVAHDFKVKKGFHGLEKQISKTECKKCHTDHKGRNYNILRLDKDMFNHDKTDFLLSGSHKNVICRECHAAKKKYRDTSSACIDCHKNSDIHKEKLGGKCNGCHGEVKWSNTRFDHTTVKFPLEGKHKKAECISCHPNSRYKKTPRTCFECHQHDDVHGGEYSKKCRKCHNFTTWKKSIFDHNKTQKIAHIKITDCYACHTDNDIHKGSYSNDCNKCHDTKKWKQTSFNHDKTQFALKGRHVTVFCDMCHTKKLYSEKLKTTCYSCHKIDDPHNGRYGQKCENCHTEKKWLESKFDHNKTEFKLTGTHKKVSCPLCHKKEIYKEKAKTTCPECHQYDDLHKGIYGTPCTPCHTPKEWKPSVFNHTETIFPNADRIKVKKCGNCSKERLGKDCYGCHRNDDVHREKEGKNCSRCHNVEGWRKNLFFDHDITSFPLIGLHAVVACEECHLNPTYKGLKKECVACHRDDDTHKKRLGPKCNRCHNPNSWSLWRFDHNTRSKYKLKEAHEGLDCLSCHKDEIELEIKLSDSCYFCHEKDSIHREGSWKKCEQCHTTKSFKEVTIIH